MSGTWGTLWGAFALLIAFVHPARADREACLDAHERAQVLRLEGAYTKARKELILCAQDRACPAPVVGDCVTWLAEVEASLPSVVFAVSDPDGQDLVDVRVSAGGTRLLERLEGLAVALDPGVYDFTFDARGYRSIHKRVTIREGEKQRIIRAELEAADEASRALVFAGTGKDALAPRSPRRRRAWIALSTLAAATLATGVTLAVLGKRELDRLEEACPGHACYGSDRARGKGLYVGADVLFGGAAGIALGAAVLFWKDRQAERARRDAGQQRALTLPGASWGPRASSASSRARERASTAGSAEPVLTHQLLHHLP